MELRGTGFFGKIPSAGDFQRMLLPEGPDARLLEWWNDGWTRHALAGRRPDLVQPTAFVVQRPGATTSLLGTMVASRDRSGRRFPLFVFGAVQGGSTADVVACSAEFLARAESVAETGRAGMDAAALRSHVESLRTAFEPESRVRQAAWLASTRAGEWSDGAPDGLPGRLRALQYAFSGGGRPNFVLRGRWQGDHRHLAAGLVLLHRLSRHVPAMLFWTTHDGGVEWRLAYEYAAAGMFEALLWHDAASAAAFDTEPCTVTIPAAFAGRTCSAAAADASLAAFLESCG